MRHSLLMSNAIANISSALGYDTVESAIMTSLSAAMAAAAAQCAHAGVESDCSPESYAPTCYPITVAPAARKAA